MIVIKLDADHPYVKDQGLNHAIALVYMQQGFDPWLPQDSYHTHEVSKEIEEAFISASMFGWDAPVAKPVHNWANNLDRAHYVPNS